MAKTIRDRHSTTKSKEQSLGGKETEFPGNRTKRKELQRRRWREGNIQGRDRRCSFRNWK